MHMNPINGLETGSVGKVPPGSGEPPKKSRNSSNFADFVPVHSARGNAEPDARPGKGESAVPDAEAGQEAPEERGNTASGKVNPKASAGDSAQADSGPGIEDTGDYLAGFAAEPGMSGAETAVAESQAGQKWQLRPGPVPENTMILAPENGLPRISELPAGSGQPRADAVGLQPRPVQPDLPVARGMAAGGQLQAADTIPGNGPGAGLTAQTQAPQVAPAGENGKQTGAPAGQGGKGNPAVQTLSAFTSAPSQTPISAAVGATETALPQPDGSPAARGTVQALSANQAAATETGRQTAAQNLAGTGRSGAPAAPVAESPTAQSQLHWDRVGETAVSAAREVRSPAEASAVASRPENPAGQAPVAQTAILQPGGAARTGQISVAAKNTATEQVETADAGRLVSGEFKVSEYRVTAPVPTAPQPIPSAGHMLQPLLAGGGAGSKTEAQLLSDTGDMLSGPLGLLGEMPGLTQLLAEASIGSHAAHRPETPRLIAAQIAEAFAAKGEQKVEVSLNPQELGHVKMRVVTSETGITMIIHTERPETGDLMRRHIHELAEEFRRMGYEDISFEFSGGQAGGDQSGQMAKGGSGPLGGAADAHSAEPADAGEAAAQNLRLGTAGVDIRV